MLADLAGKLEIIPVGELFQFLDQTRRKGLLTLVGPAGEQAHVSFVTGGLLHARHGHLRDREAVIAMLGWRKGRFELTGAGPWAGDAEPAAKEAPCGVLSLVMETARLEDELERLIGSAPGPETKLWVRDHAALPADPLDTGAQAVFTVIAAQPGVTPVELEAQLPLAPIKVRLALAWLGSTGKLGTGAALSPRPPRVLPDASDWYGEILCHYPSGIRVLVAASPALSAHELQAMVAHVAQELGASAAEMSTPGDGPSMVRLRPPAGGLLSISFLPMRQKHRVLFQTFARATDLVLVSSSGSSEEAGEWELDVPLHIPSARLPGDGAAVRLLEAFIGFARTRSQRRQRRAPRPT